MAASDAAEEVVKYILTYFDVPLRAEAIRATLQIGGELYKDVRISGEQWGDMKASTRWGSLPTLKLVEEDITLCQSHNILRHVGRMTGYYPFHDLKRAARVDELLAAWYDIMQSVAGAGAGLAGEEKVAARAAVIADDGAAGKLLEKLDSAIAEFTGGTYAVGRQLSIADIATWSYSCTLSSGILDGIPTDFIEKYQNIMKTRFLVADIPAVKKYLSKYDDDGMYAAYKRGSPSGGDEAEEEPAAEEATEVKADEEAPKAAATEVPEEAKAEPAGGDEMPQTPAVVEEEAEEESSKRAPEPTATN